MNEAEYQIPQNSPFLSQMMPRLAAAIRMNGKQLGLSQQSIEAAQKVDMEIVPQVRVRSIEIKRLELEIFELSLSDPASEKLQNLLTKLTASKLELTKIQHRCVIQLFATLEEEEADKLKAFFHKNKNLMLDRYGFIF